MAKDLWLLVNKPCPQTRSVYNLSYCAITIREYTCDLFLKDARCILLQYVHKPPKVAKMVKNSSAHTHTEWQGATPVANESVASIQVGLGHVGLGIVVALVLSVLSSLLLMFLLGNSVVSTVTTGGGLEGD